MEATEEATRVVRPTPAQADVATVVTKRGDNVGKMTLDRVAPEDEVRQARAPVATLIVVVIVIAIAVGAWMMRKNDVPPVTKPVVKAAVVPPPSPVAAAAHLGINAFPWATVTRVRNIDSGADVAMNGSLMTPAPLELPAGRYEVTLSNPQFSKPITQTIEVAAGEERTIDVHFADPSQAPLPRFGVSE